jgi:hypothetical protein
VPREPLTEDQERRGWAEQGAAQAVTAGGRGDRNGRRLGRPARAAATHQPDGCRNPRERPDIPNHLQTQLNSRPRAKFHLAIEAFSRITPSQVLRRLATLPKNPGDYFLELEKKGEVSPARTPSDFCRRGPCYRPEDLIDSDDEDEDYDGENGGENGGEHGGEQGQDGGDNMNQNNNQNNLNNQNYNNANGNISPHSRGSDVEKDFAGEEGFDEMGREVKKARFDEDSGNNNSNPSNDDSLPQFGGRRRSESIQGEEGFGMPLGGDQMQQPQFQQGQPQFQQGQQFMQNQMQSNTPQTADMAGGGGERKNPIKGELKTAGGRYSGNGIGGEKQPELQSPFNPAAEVKGHLKGHITVQGHSRISGSTTTATKKMKSGSKGETRGGDIRFQGFL